MADHAALTPERDRLAFVGLLPLMLLAPRGVFDLATLLGQVGFGLGFVLALPLLVPWLALVVVGVCALVALVRAWRALLRVREPMAFERAMWLLVVIAMGVATVFIDRHHHAAAADPAWLASQLWDLAGACCLAAVPALLLLREGVARLGWCGGRAFKGAEAFVLAVVLIAAAAVVPSLVASQRVAADQRAAELARALRIVPDSTDPYVIALCQATSDEDFGRLYRQGRVTDATLRDAWQCVPANGRQFPSERRDRFSVSQSRISQIVDILYAHDPLVVQGSRQRGPCTVGEANLVRRLKAVAPEDLYLMTLDELPEDCETPKEKAASAP